MTADQSTTPPFNEHSRTEPFWVRTALCLFPAPIFAVAAIAAAAAVSVFAALYASTERSITGWTVCATAALIASVLTAASIYRSLLRRSPAESDRYSDSRQKPTLAILLLLVSIYTWMLTIAFHVFDNFFAANVPGGLKYYVTLSIAAASSLYLRLHGHSILRAHFGNLGGQNIVVSPGQAVVVVVFIVGCGAYFTWIVL